MIGQARPLDQLNSGTAEVFHQGGEPAVDHRFRFNARVVTPLNPKLLLLELSDACNRTGPPQSGWCRPVEVEGVLRPARKDQATAAKLSRKALIVASMSASECARDVKPASKADGAR